MLFDVLWKDGMVLLTVIVEGEEDGDTAKSFSTTRMIRHDLPSLIDVIDYVGVYFKELELLMRWLFGHLQWTSFDLGCWEESQCFEVGTTGLYWGEQLTTIIADEIEGDREMLDFDEADE